ncbi:MAG: hypothetical protein K8U03_10350 [Planctomycetia bacterium]|nr:hypothetical protein [Planctomycetia bacterium]
MADRPEQSASDTPLTSAPSLSPAAAYLALDACRPGSEDLDRELPPETSAAVRAAMRADEQLAAQYRSLQQFDHVVATAFSAVSVPTNLLNRLTAAIAQQQAEQEFEQVAARSTAEIGAGEIAAPLELAENGDRQLSRRRWLRIAGGALASTAAGLSFLWWRQATERPDLTLEDVLDQTLAYHQSSDAQPREAVPVSRVPAPAEFPMSRLLVGLRSVQRWRKLDGRFLGRAGVAYELAGPNEKSATLYVLAAEGRRGSPDIPSLPDQPLNPITTGGFTLAGWREAERIQLLVVEGDAERYRGFLTHPRDVA